jgi:hypothetical protein
MFHVERSVESATFKGIISRPFPFLAFFWALGIELFAIMQIRSSFFRLVSSASRGCRLWRLDGGCVV